MSLDFSPAPVVLQTVAKDLSWYASASWRIAQRSYLRTRRDLRSAHLELTGPGEFNKVWHHVSSVGGFSTDRAESALLYALAKSGPGNGVIVEVGSFLGRATCFLAAGSQVTNRENVIAVDPFLGGTGDPGSQNEEGSISTVPFFRHNVNRLGFGDRVIAEQGTATEAGKNWSHGPIRLLFIDGLHTYEGVHADLTAFMPYLAEDAVVVFDDYFPPEFPGVRRAVDEFLEDNVIRGPLRRVNRFVVSGLDRGIAAFMRQAALEER
ncbi:MULTISPECIES: class I SAM-dependent methyltransferase [Streptomyces]|uniref:class I SAM-dependent methyltransferase n=1 Tax=Streptomyces TaxID=1883 RepID=UPI0036BCD6B0